MKLNWNKLLGRESKHKPEGKAARKGTTATTTKAGAASAGPADRPGRSKAGIPGSDSPLLSAQQGKKSILKSPTDASAEHKGSGKRKAGRTFGFTASKRPGVHFPVSKAAVIPSAAPVEDEAGSGVPWSFRTEGRTYFEDVIAVETGEGNATWESTVKDIQTSRANDAEKKARLQEEFHALSHSDEFAYLKRPALRLWQDRAPELGPAEAASMAGAETSLFLEKAKARGPYPMQRLDQADADLDALLNQGSLATAEGRNRIANWRKELLQWDFGNRAVYAAYLLDRMEGIAARNPALLEPSWLVNANFLTAAKAIGMEKKILKEVLWNIALSDADVLEKQAAIKLELQVLSASSRWRDLLPEAWEVVDTVAIALKQEDWPRAGGHPEPAPASILDSRFLQGLNRLPKEKSFLKEADEFLADGLAEPGRSDPERKTTIMVWRSALKKVYGVNSVLEKHLSQRLQELAEENPAWVDKAWLPNISK